MILFIDSTDFNKVTYALQDGQEIKKRSFKIDPHKSHEALRKLEGFLKSTGVSPHLPASSPQKEKRRRIQKIYVNKGPGSYTGTRVGVTHALALGYAWGVPVRALAKNVFDKKINTKNH